MKVQIQGGNLVSLTQKDFLASGGEGNIFVIGGTTYKVYSDPTKMIPVGKIQELAEIKDPRVIKPEKVLLDPKNSKPIGFTSKFVHNSGALCQVFPRAFRDRNGITPGDIGELVNKLRSLVSNVHAAKSLIVDLNEMNFLLGQRMEDIYAIDVASYQTPHYRATALMESVRDRHMKPGEFTEGTDWFAFGILSFQMFIGIHPYKGTHPSVKGLEERMQNNLSVLNKDVRVPQTCYAFSAIPKAYMDWYRAIFEKGQRVAPPGEQGVVVAVMVPTNATLGTKVLDIQEMHSFPFDGDILGVWDDVVVTEKTVYYKGRQIGPSAKNTRGVGFTKGGKPVVASLQGVTPTLFDAGAKVNVPCGLVGDGLTSYDGRLYLKNGDKIVTMSLMEVGADQKVLAAPEIVAHTLEHATKLFDGVAVQNLLGSTYVSVFPTAGASYQIRIPELDGTKLLDAKFDRGVLMVLCARNGVYERDIFRLDETMTSYDIRVVPDVTPSGLNFVTLDSGVCVCLTEEEKLEMFSARMGSTGIRVVEDAVLGGDMKLFKRNGKVLFARGRRLYSLSLK